MCEHGQESGGLGVLVRSGQTELVHEGTENGPVIFSFQIE